jgi:serine/threonine-protein kinase
MQSHRSLPFLRIGKYRLVAHIATGGMGTVYKGVDEENRRLVALKVLPPEMAENPTLLERFRREAGYAAQLQHKNIVTLYEYGQEEGVHFLAMEYVEGIDLSEYIRRQGTIDPEEARRIVMQACRALDHAFKQGITHRDIKPSNFLLANEDGRCRVKMTDMGLSRGVHEEHFRVTRAGTTVGTVDYMSPEQARDSASADVRSDIYSLGCSLYHMLAGHPPFNEGGLGERIYKHLAVEPPDVRLFNPAVPTPLWTILRRMLAKHPDDRFQTPHELFQALRSIGEPITSPSDPEETVTSLPAPESVEQVGTDDKPPSSRDTTFSLPTPAPAPTPVPTPPPEANELPPARKKRRTKVDPATSAPRSGPGRPGNEADAKPKDQAPPDTFTVSPEQRQAAAGQFARAREVQVSDNTNRDYALQLLLSSCKLDPGNIPYRKDLRQVGRAQEQARGSWLGSLALLPIRSRFRSARSSGDHRKALEVGEEILLRAPTDTGVQIEMADSAEALGLPTLAVWMLEQAKQQGPSAPVLKALADLYERHRLYRQALVLWEQIHELDPSDTTASQKITDLSAKATIARVNRR